MKYTRELIEDRFRRRIIFTHADAPYFVIGTCLDQNTLLCVQQIIAKLNVL